MFFDYRLHDHEYRIHITSSPGGIWKAEALGYKIVAEGTTDTDAIRNLQAAIRRIDNERRDDEITIVYTR